REGCWQRATPQDGLHLHAAGAAPAELLSREGWERLPADVLFGDAPGISRRLHGDFWLVACRNEFGLWAPGGGELFDGRAGRRAAGLSQRDFAGSIRCSAHWGPDAISH